MWGESSSTKLVKELTLSHNSHMNKLGDSFERDVWHVLSKIKELLLYTKSNRIYLGVFYNTIPRNPQISDTAEGLVLRRLKEIGVLTIREHELTSEEQASMRIAGPAMITFSKPIPAFDWIEVVEEKFNKLYKEYEQKNIKSMDNDSTVIFHLTQAGELYRTPRNGDRQSYLMVRDKMKHRLIEALQKEPKTSKILAAELDTSAKNISKEIAVLRKEIEKHFDIDGKDFIPDAQTGVGYRFGKNIKVLEERK